MRLSRRVKVAFSVFVFAAVALTIVWALLPALITPVGPAAGELVCTDNLKQITIALAAYHDEHGRYPPAYVSDSKGVPLHSWRVLLLKYLDKELYDLYDFNEPWDGPKNKKLLSKMPAVYSCPNFRYVYREPRQGESFIANYLALVGPNSPLQGNKSKSKSEIFVGTMLIAEVADSGILWMEPRDLDVSQINWNSIECLGSLISSKDPSGAGVILGELRIVRLE